MGARGKLGWLIAGALAFGWWSSSPDGTERHPGTLSASVAPKPKIQPTSAFYKPDAIAPPIEQALQGKVQWLYASTAARVRAGPSTDAAVLHTVLAGEPVQSNGRRGNWHSVTVAAQVGWIRGDLLRASPPLAVAPQPAAAPLIEIPKKQRAPKAQPARSGQPIREPYVGTCDCPYDRMRNGRRCGGNSAYSRPGGSSPVCYL